LIAAAVAVLAAAGGVKLSRLPTVARGLIPFSGGLLGGIALFGIGPELSERHGALGGLLLMGGGLVLLWIIGRWVYAICPACSHTHDHSNCPASLHGFAVPLVLAASLHSFFDGLSIAAAGEGSKGLAVAMLVGVALHKILEGVALGVILWAALNSRWAALAWTGVVQGATVLGAAAESLAASQIGGGWVTYPLTLAGASFLYLAYHAVHAEWRNRGAVPAFAPALVGAFGAALLQHGLHAWLH